MKDLAFIKKEVERVTGIKDISKRSRLRGYVYARALYFILAKEDNLDNTLQSIGALVKKDHSTVIHFLRIKDQLLKDKEFRTYYDRLKPEDFNKVVDDYEKEILLLRERNALLKDQLEKKFTTGLRRSHAPLLEIINNIPDYHVETVRVRLQPIVKMLERPSRHNYLPQN